MNTELEHLVKHLAQEENSEVLIEMFCDFEGTITYDLTIYCRMNAIRYKDMTLEQVQKELLK